MRSAADVLMLTTPCGSQLESSYLYAYPFCKDVLYMFTAQSGREAPCESRWMDEMEIKKDKFGRRLHLVSNDGYEVNPCTTMR